MPNRNVLLVEDEPALRALLMTSLERAHFQVTAVDNGLAAIRQLGCCKFDIIVTDVLMPEADGLEVIAVAKELQPQARILAISGGSRSLDAQFCLRLAGALSHGGILMKPFKPHQFLAAVAELETAPVRAA